MGRDRKQPFDDVDNSGEANIYFYCYPKERTQYPYPFEFLISTITIYSFQM